MRQLLLPIHPALDRSPELAPLAILDDALTTSESALLAACPELQLPPEHLPRGHPPTTRRANAIILQARRLAVAIAAYRDALQRDARRLDCELRRRTF